jgi:4-hydroxybenzoate polyprenyltransferase
MNLKASFRLLRPHQWMKNLLCFVPLLLSHQWQQQEAVVGSCFAFLTFSLLASVIYVINDVLDAAADRNHPKKCHRPIASRLVSPLQALLLGLLLTVVILIFASRQPDSARYWLVIYTVIAVGYSLRFKQYLALDVVLISLFYGLRMLYGAAVAGIVVSVWTIVFSMFMFLTLALVKRLSEVDLMEEATHDLGRRPYRLKDRPALFGMACASAYTALLVVGLYLNSPEVRLIHQHPQWLWLLLPALVYWLTRILIIVQRSEMHHDPVVFAMRDKASWLVLIWIVVVLVVAK